MENKKLVHKFINLRGGRWVPKQREKLARDITGPPEKPEFTSNTFKKMKNSSLISKAGRATRFSSTYPKFSRAGTPTRSRATTRRWSPSAAPSPALSSCWGSSRRSLMTPLQPVSTPNPSLARPLRVPSPSGTSSLWIWGPTRRLDRLIRRKIWTRFQKGRRKMMIFSRCCRFTGRSRTWKACPFEKRVIICFIFICSFCFV